VGDARDAYIKLWSTFHQAAFEVTEGKVLNRILGMPVVRLETTGRRTGVVRATMLTAPIVEVQRIVVLASNGGAPRHPQWYLNLLASPQVLVTADGCTRTMRGRVAEEPERSEVLAEIRRVTPSYAIYQRRTAREIPVVVLEPLTSK
jgi:deazaflavin-dependent oxidoreductase (nitroreductase family)